MAFRFAALTLFFGVLFVGLGFNLYRLQVEKRSYYIERAQARNDALEELDLRRGNIFFTDRSETEIPVALNRDLPFIYAVPRDIKNPESIANALSSIIELDELALIKQLSDSDSLFKLLVDQASQEQIDSLNVLGLTGIYIGERQHRFYPFETLASHVLGFAGINKTTPVTAGLYGIEKSDEEVLARGESVYLTVDRNLQAEAEQILARLVEKHAAQGGTVIIQDPKSGKIIALANNPTFDPNTYSKEALSSFPNPAVQYVYEPGSVFKPITMAAGIDSGVITPTSTYVDAGFVTLNGKTIRNWDLKAYGKITMTNVIERSVNTGAVYVEQQIGHERFTNYLHSFGFGAATNVDLPDEVNGSLKNLSRKDARAIDFATASFGQGTSVTPIQLVTAFSTIANGGLLMQPFIHGETKPTVVRRVISEATSEKVTGMMESAVTKAIIAAIPHYRIAGKTGTAFVPDFVRGGYSDELIHTYVGFGPISDPRFTVLVKLDKPTIGELAGSTVVPAFRELAQFIINYYNIPPDNIERVLQ